MLSKVAIFILIMSSFFTIHSAEESVFTFTAIPDQDASRLEQRFGKVSKYLSKKLNMKVKYVPVKSYAAAITAFRNNQVQLAWFGGLSGVRARALVPGSVAIAQGFEDPNFITYFIAHHSTGLSKSDTFPVKIKGQSFTFGSKGSTSGRLMPEYHIREKLGEPNKVFSNVGFSGDHSRTIALVQAGSYKVGAVNYQVWDTMLKEGKIKLDQVSVIWKTPTYPDYQWSIRGDVDKVHGKGMIQKVQKALLKMSDPDLLQSFPRTKFIKAENKDYSPIEKTAKALDLID